MRELGLTEIAAQHFGINCKTGACVEKISYGGAALNITNQPTTGFDPGAPGIK